jgi:hypothetical protein
LTTSKAYRVEGDVDASGLLGHGVGVLLDGFLVQSVDLRHLGDSPRGGDLVGHLVERLPGATGEEDVCPLAGEGTGNRTAD